VIGHNARNNSLLKKINTLKHQHFLHWPHSFQRAAIGSGAILFWVCFMQFVGTGGQQIALYKSQIAELSQKIKIQQETIQQAQQHYKNAKVAVMTSRINPLNLSNFVGKISSLAKQNNVEISAIKPIQSRQQNEIMVDFKVRSFQINVTGEYDNLLRFMRHINTMLDLGMVDDFRLTATSAENILGLVMVVDLYGRSSL